MSNIENEVEAIPPTTSATTHAAHAARSSILSLSVQLISAVVAYMLQIVLAWYLSHDDFGILALASSFTMVVGVFRDAGASRILVQRHREFDRIAGTLFWLTLCGSILCGVITTGAAHVLGRIYQQPELIPVMYWMAIRFPISALGTISGARLAIDMRWGVINAITLVSLAVLSFVSIAMARAGYGVFTLVVPPLFGDATRGGLQWIYGRARTHFAPDWNILRGVFSNSAALIGSGLAVAARSQGDYIVLGLLSTVAQTGRYFFAYTTAGIAIRLIGGSLTQVLYPIFARVANQSKRSESVYLRSLHALALIIVPLAVLQATLAKPMFRFLLPRFYDSALLFSILSFVHLLLVLNTVMVQPVHAAGFFKRAMVFDWIFAPFEVSLFWIGAKVDDVLGVTIFCLLSAIIGFIAWHWIMLRQLEFNRSEAIRPLWKPLVGSIPIVILASLADHFLPHRIGFGLLTLLSVSVFGGLLYLLIIRLIWRPVFVDLTRLIRVSIPFGKLNTAH